MTFTDTISGTPAASSGGRRPIGEMASTIEHALAPLQLSTKSSVWGDASGNALEPVDREWGQGLARGATLQQHHYRCMFCGLQSASNEVHNRNDNHRDVQADNLGVADAICHRWQHLGELGQGNGLLVYLPGLAPRDVSHLLRTLLIALQSGDRSTRDDGRRLLNWMASHHQYVAEAWGSSDPSVFAAAITRTAQEDKGRRALAFEHLALVLNPETLGDAVQQWAAEATAKWPVTAWARVHHDVMNAPT
jgi:intracellular multiplication protein IcmJ